MRKSTPFLNEEKGFILPIVLLIAALLFLFVSTNITIYHNELTIAKNEISQLKIDTLFQMGRSKLKNEISSLNPRSGTVEYSFPDGDVKISYIRKQEVYELAIYIYTPDKKVFAIANHMEADSPN
ncbi:competence type IV pilus minor pilin ComGG [Virgibacillus necropolis]|uniref:Competence protein ComG n=1 Tax=Virgibacillus necropolis TaxID=163877 RepID=A0A221MCA5_9BACI|nr:competence type IV pilus minor pilin ComGG [Virgibacillus necropolis]ASN05242.1 hypothetical protein CFK40_09555 [Virgibacillus necropolis]